MPRFIIWSIILWKFIPMCGELIKVSDHFPHSSQTLEPHHTLKQPVAPVYTPCVHSKMCFIWSWKAGRSAIVMFLCPQVMFHILESLLEHFPKASINYIKLLLWHKAFSASLALTMTFSYDGEKRKKLFSTYFHF